MRRLPDIGTRRVPGLRRGQVAALAGVSVEYYAKLERGAIAGVASSVLDAIGRAMHSAVYDTSGGGQPNFASFTFLDLDAGVSR